MVGWSAGGGEGVDGVEGGEVDLSRLFIASVCVVWFIAYIVQVGVLKRSRAGVLRCRVGTGVVSVCGVELVSILARAFSIAVWAERRKVR